MITYEEVWSFEWKPASKKITEKRLCECDVVEQFTDLYPAEGYKKGTTVYVESEDKYYKASHKKSYKVLSMKPDLI